MSHVYDNTFYDYIEQGSRASARAMIARLSAGLRIGTVLDVGCGRGAWLSEWEKAGFGDIQGIDGDYVDRAALHIDPARFRGLDLSRPFDLERRFDLVQCLEVAEHLPGAASADLVASLVRHGDVVLFSAAVPGQGGENHINERPLSFWRGLFREHGYTAFDWVRPDLKTRPEVMNWYKFNALIYASKAGQARLSEAVLACRLADGEPVPDVETLAWKLRRLIVRPLPRFLVDRIAAANAQRQALQARTRG